ncbi:MAG: DUF2061 domain-containing protein [Nitrospirota bacterium]|nr:DUF2061 domain-containing protein [Nitrospirota bacterium]
METHLRSVVKGLSWRVFATIVTMVVVWFYTGELSDAALVGFTDASVKIVLYWGHERVWQQIRWGRIFPTVSSP